MEEVVLLVGEEGGEDFSYDIDPIVGHGEVE